MAATSLRGSIAQCGTHYALPKRLLAIMPHNNQRCACIARNATFIDNEPRR